MNKNLVITISGDSSTHSQFLTTDRNFDLFVVYYGDKNNAYESDGDYYERLKGTKFNIVSKLDKDIIRRYEYVFVPDDDLVINSDRVSELFDLSREYKFDLCQPSIIGYYSLGITLNRPESLFRYTNYVEIMCPCFSLDAFNKCHHTFDHTTSCWGIDMWWNKILGEPKDKISIIDSVVAFHPRPCFSGDNYTNNKITDPINDVYNLVEKYGISFEKITHETIGIDVDKIPHKDRFYPAKAIASLSGLRFL